MKSPLPYRLLAPGPVPVPPAVMRAMGEKVIHHRTPQFMAILKDVWRRLKFVYQTQEHVFILTGTGSAAMEAAVVNLLSPGEEALVVVSGKFGERWADICERFGTKTVRWNIPWGEALNLENFEEQLHRHPNVKVVFSQACETSTATVHPIREMAAAVRKTKALFAVDAITAVGCMPLPMDEWEIDVVVAGSQKAFMIPAGLSFISLSPRAWKAQGKTPRFYFNLAAEKKANDGGDSQFSIPTPLAVGLGIVLEQIEKKGLEHLWKRSLALSQATRACGELIGLETYSHSPAPSVTALMTPTDSTKIRDWLEKEKNITIMGGQDQAKGKILRIGHMGDVRDEDMLALFEGLCEHLGKDFQQEVKPELQQLLKVAGPLFP